MSLVISQYLRSSLCCQHMFNTAHLIKSLKFRDKSYQCHIICANLTFFSSSENVIDVKSNQNYLDHYFAHLHELLTQRSSTKHLNICCSDVFTSKLTRHHWVLSQLYAASLQSIVVINVFVFFRKMQKKY